MVAKQGQGQSGRLVIPASEYVDAGDGRRVPKAWLKDKPEAPEKKTAPAKPEGKKGD